jgi:cytochrome c oxidase accessory protein FixG
VFVAVKYGRVWCGWACPQTIFVGGVFRRIEALIEGNAHERRQLDQQPMNFSKLFKRSIKWVLFLICALVISNSLLAYFVGADRMAAMVQNSPDKNPSEFFITAFTTLILLFDFGWFREQFCIIMCPYGRMQSVMMDNSSLVVMYDQKRGEPRKGAEISNSSETKTGDCVNCFKCVAVCPTGIDIRRGTQLECIACAACIDACNEIMTKVKKPQGLIRYGREDEGQKKFQAKTLFFGLILVLIFSGLGYSLASREDLSYAVLRASGTPYQQVTSDLLSNHFHLEANNHLPRQINLHVSSQDAQIVMAANPISLSAGKTNRVDFFIQFPKTLLRSGSAKALLRLNIEGDTKTYTQELPLVGPF